MSVTTMPSRFHVLSALAAPFDGTVVAVHARTGELAQLDRPVLTLATLDQLQIETTDLSERDIAKIKIGQTATVFVDALNAEFPATVTAIAPRAEKVGGEFVDGAQALVAAHGDPRHGGREAQESALERHRRRARVRVQHEQQRRDAERDLHRDDGEEEREAGHAALAMGMIGITEGAIPFAAADPIRVIPSIMFGSMVAAIASAGRRTFACTTRPSVPMRMLAGLMSRCTTPASCSAAC